MSDGTPRERIVLDPGEDYPDRAGDLRLLGEKITQPPAPSHPILCSMVGPGLLAHILVAKFDNHIPLYRQNEIFARMGADIPSSTLVDWCGQGMRVLAPLIARTREEIMTSDHRHADDTPIKVLDPSQHAQGISKGIKEGRIWAYVRADRPWGSSAPPGAVYYFSTDRKGKHPQSHLAKFKGILQADAFSGFKNSCNGCSARARGGLLGPSTT